MFTDQLFVTGEYMRKRIISLILMASMLSMVIPTVPVVAKQKKGEDVTSIQDGAITYSAGHYLYGTPLTLGFDPYGYNYQGHMFKGSYYNAYSGGAGYPPWLGDDETYLAENPDAEYHWAWPYREVKLTMKWNDAWLSNMDRDGDGALDRHYGFDTYIGSGAWETNHMWGEYPDGTKWNYFCKIVAVPSDAVLDGGVWYLDGVEIGPVIWGEFATIFQVSNDPYLDEHGVLYDAPGPTGFGYYMP
jgi:hypothetical protein